MRVEKLEQIAAVIVTAGLVAGNHRSAWWLGERFIRCRHVGGWGIPLSVVASQDTVVSVDLCLGSYSSLGRALLGGCSRFNGSSTADD